MQARELRMALKSAKTANFRQPRVVIHAHFQIRIALRSARRGKFIGKTKEARVAAEFKRTEIQVTIGGNPGHSPGANALQVPDQPAQAQKITLIKRHQADETASRRTPGSLAPLIR